MIVAFAGVHGSGKTTTARRLCELLEDHAGLECRCIELEAIGDVRGLNAVARQLLFASKFTYHYVMGMSSKADVIVYTSHPVMVIPYTAYWLVKTGVSDEVIVKSLLYIKGIIDLLPPPDILVYLRVADNISVDIIRSRIIRRGELEKDERNVEEEANPLYIKAISLLTDHVIDVYRRRNWNILDVEARLEADMRARVIYDSVLGLTHTQKHQPPRYY